MAEITPPVLPIPTRLPNRDDLSHALEIAKSLLTPPDPYEAAGKAVEQYRSGHPLDAAETMYGSMPQTGAIIAYHGSPHQFDRFDISKIGTGEGAQAYGHGLYFADSEDVARSYRDNLSRRNIDATFDGKPVEKWPAVIDEVNKENWRLGKLLDEYGRVGGDYGDFLRRQRDWYRGQPEMQSALSEFEKRVSANHTPGSMYQVRINADPEHFIDYEMPLSAQSPFIQERLLRAGWSPEHMKSSVLDGAYVAPTTPFGSQKYAEAGLPGIRYLDQGSRTAGEGSRNYVVFDDKLVDILKRYAKGGEVGDMIQDRFPSHYLSGVGRQVMADGGAPAPSAAITGPHTITASDLVGVAAPAGQNYGAYADAGGQQIAAPFVSSMSGGYPVYNMPSPSTSALPPHVQEMMDRLRHRGQRPGAHSFPSPFAGGYAEGGPVDDAISLAKRIADERSMSHPVGMSGSVEFAPVEIEEPLTGYKAHLGSVPKETAAVVNPMLQAGSEIAPYFTPAAPAAMARDAIVGLRSGDPLNIGLAALGAPGKSAKAGFLAAAAMAPQSAEASPAQKALDYVRRLTDRGFYSPAAEAVAGVKQQKGRVGDFVNAIRGRPGVTADELSNAGLESAFAPNESVTRDQIIDYLHGKLPNVQETVLGGNRAVSSAQDTADRALLDLLNDVPRDDYGAAQDAARIAEAEARRSGYKPTKFQQYALPGGENYREVLMTLPPKAPDTKIALGEARAPGSEYGNREFAGRWQGRQLVEGVTEYPFKVGDEEGTITHWPQTFRYNGEPAPAMWLVNSPGMQGAGFPSLEAAQAGLQREAAANFGRPPKDAFKSSHWDEPNVLAHLRMSDRDRALHIDEIQSDWGQEGREKGFRDVKERELANLVRRREEMTARSLENPNDLALIDQLNAIHDRIGDLGRGDVGVPSGPYVTSTEGWTDLALKRALQEAARGNYDRMVWTPGAEQAARYNLAKHIGSIAHTRLDGPEDLYSVALSGPRGENVGHMNAVPFSRVREALGKEIAEKIAQGHGDVMPNTLDKWRRISDLDMSVGGQGMKDYYDSIVPTRLQKLVKKLGQSPLIEMSSHELPQGSGTGPVMGHALHMTPELREAILKGLPAFRRGGEIGNALELARTLAA